jgi:predicted RNA-binding protein with PUA-like domain
MTQKTTKPAVTSPASPYWLLKSEPDVFSWDMLVAKGDAGESWDGVRNYLARNNMRAMKLGDRGFFYHSNIGKEVVGILEIIRLAHPDPKDDTGTWQCVTVKAVAKLPKPVTLIEVKQNPKLATMQLVVSMRLSVQPVTADEWAEVCRMGGLTAIDAQMSPSKTKTSRKASA